MKTKERRKKENVEKMIKNNRGITLIALVVTIIALLILAGVTIATLTEENGILTKASQASEQTKIAEEKESIGIAYAGVLAGKRGTEVSDTDLQTELRNNGYNVVVTDEEDGTLNVFFEDSQNNYNVNKGTIIQTEGMTYGQDVWYKYEEINNEIKITGIDDSIGEDILSAILAENPNFYEDLTGDSEEKAMGALELYEKVYAEYFQGKYASLGNIPKQINGKNVVEIGDKAFAEVGIFTLRIPNTVKIIGELAFIRNNLTTVDIPDSVTTIGSRAFERNQLTSVKLPNKITCIEQMTFYDNDITSITIPSSVREIGVQAFWGNRLTHLQIPEGVTTIGRAAFLANNSLTSVKIAGTVKEIGTSAFDGCPLDSVEFEGVPTTISGGIFYDGGQRYDNLIENTVKVPVGTIAQFKAIPLADWGLRSYDAFYE